MTLVADRIVKWSLLSEETTCVKWSGQEMMLRQVNVFQARLSLDCPSHISPRQSRLRFWVSPPHKTEHSDQGVQTWVLPAQSTWTVQLKCKSNHDQIDLCKHRGGFMRGGGSRGPWPPYLPNPRDVIWYNPPYFLTNQYKISIKNPKFSSNAHFLAQGARKRNRFFLLF